MSKSREQLKEEGFTLTDIDTNQWVKQLSETHFLVYEKERVFDIELNDYSEEEIDDFISAYYPSVTTLRESYGGQSNWIIAECIAEQDCY
jgi:hypothetical protein